MKETNLVAVYGTLRKGEHNHHIIKHCTLIGEVWTNPSFTLIDLGSYPGLLTKGRTSVKLEIYKIYNTTTLKNLDNLEGYFGKDSSNNLYNKELINTPFGEASIYIYNFENYGKDSENYSTITSGDWVEYKNTKIAIS